MVRYYIGDTMYAVVNIASTGAVTGAAVVYLILITSFTISVADYFYCECMLIRRFSCDSIFSLRLTVLFLFLPYLIIAHLFRLRNLRTRD